MSNFLKKLINLAKKKHIPMNVDDAADLLERQITKIEPAIEKFYTQLKSMLISMALTFQESKVRFLTRQKLLKSKLIRKRKKLPLRKKL